MTDKTPTRRLRVAHVLVQPVLVWDDGNELSPGPQLQATQLQLSQVAATLAAVPQQIAELERQLLDADADGG